MTVHIIGAQRTGTNYLVEIIRLNLTASVLPTGDRTLCWKHALPHETRGALQPAGNAVDASGALICLIAKHPVQWVSSLRRGRHDLFLKHPELLDRTGELDLDRTLEFYRAFYDAWLMQLRRRRDAFGTRHLVMSYEAALHDPSATLAMIGAAIDATPADSVTLPDRVPYSARVTPARRAELLAGYHDLEPDEVARIEAFFAADTLLDELGYQPTSAGRRA